MIFHFDSGPQLSTFIVLTKQTTLPVTWWLASKARESRRWEQPQKLEKRICEFQCLIVEQAKSRQVHAQAYVSDHLGAGVHYLEEDQAPIVYDHTKQGAAYLCHKDYAVVLDEGFIIETYRSSLGLENFDFGEYDCLLRDRPTAAGFSTIQEMGRALKVVRAKLG